MRCPLLQVRNQIGCRTSRVSVSYYILYLKNCEQALVVYGLHCCLKVGCIVWTFLEGFSIVLWSLWDLILLLALTVMGPQTYGSVWMISAQLWSYGTVDLIMPTDVSLHKHLAGQWTYWSTFGLYGIYTWCTVCVLVQWRVGGLHYSTGESWTLISQEPTKTLMWTQRDLFLTHLF